MFAQKRNRLLLLLLWLLLWLRTAKSPYWHFKALFFHPQCDTLEGTLTTTCFISYRWKKSKRFFSKIHEGMHIAQRTNCMSIIKICSTIILWIYFELVVKLQPLFFSLSLKISKRKHDNWYYSSNKEMDFICGRLEFTEKMQHWEENILIVFDFRKWNIQNNDFWQKGVYLLLLNAFLALFYPFS